MKPKLDDIDADSITLGISTSLSTQERRSYGRGRDWRGRTGGGGGEGVQLQFLPKMGSARIGISAMKCDALSTSVARRRRRRFARAALCTGVFISRC